MKHTSVPLEMPCEFINIVPLNPLISKCQIKVCYVDDKPNRNRSVITKEVAKKMANSLPGSPIVGCFNESIKDFEEHSKDIHVSNGKLKIKEATRPYGFVDLNAKCWFQKFLDDGLFEREYLVTEGYLWTGQYPEAQRIIDFGNNQSMELNEDFLDAKWTKDHNGKPQFFIINEAIVEKLCVLGEESEPCFEGSTITSFSLSADFMTEMRSMMEELKELLNKEGGIPMADNKDFSLEENIQNPEPELETEFKKKDDEEKKDKESEDAESAENNKEEDKDDKSNTSESKDSTEDDSKNSDEDKKEDKDDEDDKKKKKYSLEEIPEYVSLNNAFSELTVQYNTLKEEKANLESQLQSLKEFKLGIEKKAKEDMINNTFYMLSEEDKKDVLDNIDTYSLDEIEAKLSIICVRNKVSFAALEDDSEPSAPTTYNLGENLFQDESTPAWVKAVLDTAKTLN